MIKTSTTTSKNIFQMDRFGYLILTILILITSSCDYIRGSDVPPDSTSTGSQVTPTISSCLIGIWEVQSKETFLRALIPVGAFDQKTLKYKGMLGGVAYRFDPMGGLLVEAEGVQGRFDVRTVPELKTLDFKMQGFAGGDYEIEGDVVRIPKMTNSAMNFSAIYDDEEMMSDVKADSFLPLFVEPYNAAKFKCDQNTLTLEILNLPSIEEPIQFKRLR
jgi:hypothetical protein